MSDRSGQIEALKKVFEQAKSAQRDEDGELSDTSFFGKLYSALTVVGKEYMTELKDEVYYYLQDPCSDLRAEAIRTLGWNTRLGLEDFCLNEAPKIWLNDPDEEVKIAALAAWASYYSCSKDSKMLKTLYEILRSHQYSVLIRGWALSEFFNISDGWIDKVKEYNEIIKMEEELEDNNEFDKVIDWHHVHKIMQECVPGWQPVDRKN